MLQYQLLDWCHQNALCTEFLQLTDDFPEALLIENGVDRAPLLVCQWDDGRALDTRQYLGNLLDLRLRGIHHHVLLVLSRAYSLEA